MNTHPGFEELLQLLEEYRVDYMIVDRLRQALIAFGFTEPDLPVEAFTTSGNILTFGAAPRRAGHQYAAPGGGSSRTPAAAP